MKVKELIKRLQMFDQDLDVEIQPSSLGAEGGSDIECVGLGENIDGEEILILEYDGG